MTTAERTARLWLRAYPRRWRYSSGEDLVGTLLDLAGPDARTVRLRDGLSVLRAGWMLRLREHPPLVPWVRYRLFGADLPADYRVWMIDDLLGRLHALRWFVAYLILLVGSMGLFSAVAGDLDVWTQMLSGWPWWVGFGVLSTVVGPRYSARTVWLKHVSGWVPPELRPRRHRAEAARELAEFRAASGYEGPSSPLVRG